MNKSRW